MAEQPIESQPEVVGSIDEAQPEEGVRRGPPDAPEHGFSDIAHHAARKAALDEYRRTVEEFRQTGTLTEKEWEDFAHLTNPPNLQLLVHDAHCQAVAAIENWQDEEEERRALEESHTRRAAAIREAEEARRVADIRDWEAAKQRRPEDDERDLREAASILSRLQPPEPPLPKIRGVEFDARAPSKLYSYRQDDPPLDLDRPEEPPLSPDLETEAMLRAMIGECHFLMREVSFRSMCQARVMEDRRSWVETSMKLAKTGASVAKAIGRLRHGPQAKQTHHTTTMITKVIAAAQAGGGGATIP